MSKSLSPALRGLKTKHERDRKTFLSMLTFLVSAAFAGTVFYILNEWRAQNFSVMEANIISIFSCLFMFIGLRKGTEHFLANLSNYKISTSQSQISDIAINANIETKDLIIDILSKCDAMKEDMSQGEREVNINKILKATGKLETYVKNSIYALEMMVSPPHKKITPASFRENIYPVIDRCAIYARWNNINLQCNIDSQLPEQMEIDIRGLKLALQNTLQDTINHTTGNKIELSIESKETDGFNSFVVIKVTDKESKKADSLKSSSSKPNDIASYVTNKLIENAGGFIEHNTYNKGLESENIYIPYIKHDESPKNSPAALLSNLKLDWKTKHHYSSHKILPDCPPNILIVDDHPANIMLLHKFIDPLKHNRIDESAGGQQAVRLYNMHHHQVIFMDCQMPDMDGFTASETIRGIEAKHKLTPSIIIGVTADTTRTARKKSAECGMNELIYKPISREQLTEIMQKHSHNVIQEPVKAPVVPSLSEKEKPRYLDEHMNLDSSKMQISQMPVNLKRLRSYTEGNHEEERIFFDIFIEQAKETLSILETTLESHNETDWCQAAHKLKGSSANLGAEQLAELCQIAEHHDNTIADEDILQAIKSELTKVDEFMHTLLDTDALDNSTQLH